MWPVFQKYGVVHLAVRRGVRRVGAWFGLLALTLAGQAHVTAPARKASPGGTYTVAKGDTLSRVARRTGVSVKVLAAANGIADVDRIRAGQVLEVPKEGEAERVTVPALPSAVVVVGGGRVHRVVGGDTLIAIANAYGTTVAELAATNGLKNPNRIRLGAQLQVPGPPWLCPVQGRHQFSNGWGQLRAGGRRHEGVDIFAPRGTPVVASVDGALVHAAGPRAGLAYYLRGDDGNTYYGAHLNTVAPEGRVARGAVVGTVGSTGNARGTTPHLHFEIKPGGGPPVNPYPTLVRWC